MISLGSLKKSRWSALLVLALLWACSVERKSDSISGTATDAENTLAGTILDSAGTPVAGAQVRLVTDSIGYASSVQFLGKVSVLNLDSTGSVRTTITGPDGRYEFDQVDSSLFFHLSVAYRTPMGVPYATVLPGVYLNSPAVRRIAVTRASAISGVMEYYRGTDPRYQFSNHFYVTVVGTGLVYSVFDGEPFTLTGVPAGFHDLLLFPADKGMVQLMLNRGLPMDSMVYRAHVQFAAGDTLNLGTLQWSLPSEYLGTKTDTSKTDTTPKPMIRTMSGTVLSYLGEPVVGAEVRLVLDTFGFAYSKGFTAGDSFSAVTDAKGRWSLPIPAVAFFNLEFLKYFKADSLVGYSLLSRVRGPKATDMTLAVDTVVLMQPARIEGMIRYTEEPNAWIDIGSHFRVGIKGTTRYVDVISQQEFSLTGLPSGDQTLVYYPGDSFLWPTFESELGSLEEMVGTTKFLGLTPGTVQKLQVDTYTLPTKP